MAKTKRNAANYGDPGTPDGAPLAHEASGETNGQAPAKPREGKADKFRRLANRRVPNAVKRIKHVLNLCNRNQYDWTHEQAEKIIDKLDELVNQIRDKLTGVDIKIDDSWQL